jgi:hypothetical protein
MPLSRKKCRSTAIAFRGGNLVKLFKLSSRLANTLLARRFEPTPCLSLISQPG